jgi:hypothetical protein
MTPLKKRFLYFGIDGTILDKSTKAVKKNLQNGQLELKIKNANFDKIICIGIIDKIFNGLRQMGQHVDSVEIIYTLCFDAFTDFDWFINMVVYTKNNDQRIKQIDFAGDWWYMDNSAEKHFRSVGKNEIYKQQNGNRILIPNPVGDGQDIISWFETIT